MIGGGCLCLYVVAAFVEPLRHRPEAQDARQIPPPTTIHLVDAQGHFHLRPFVYGTTQKRDPDTLELFYAAIQAKSTRSISW